MPAWPPQAGGDSGPQGTEEEPADTEHKLRTEAEPRTLVWLWQGERGPRPGVSALCFPATLPVFTELLVATLERSVFISPMVWHYMLCSIYSISQLNALVFKAHQWENGSLLRVTVPEISWQLVVELPLEPDPRDDRACNFSIKPH